MYRPVPFVNLSPLVFTLVCLVIFDKCQMMCMKNWTQDDVIFYRGFILFSDTQLGEGGEGED